MSDLSQRLDIVICPKCGKPGYQFGYNDDPRLNRLSALAWALCKHCIFNWNELYEPHFGHVFLYAREFEVSSSDEELVLWDQFLTGAPSLCICSYDTCSYDESEEMTRHAPLCPLSG